MTKGYLLLREEIYLKEDRGETVKIDFPNNSLKFYSCGYKFCYGTCPQVSYTRAYSRHALFSLPSKTKSFHPFFCLLDYFYTYQPYVNSSSRNTLARTFILFNILIVCTFLQESCVSVCKVNDIITILERMGYH